MSAEEIYRMSLEEFEEWERQQDSRYEYINGVIYNMAGAPYTHNQIAGNLIALLHNAAPKTGCSPKPSDMGVRLSDRNVYPDVVVNCGKPEFHNNRKDILTNPIVVVEVLSESTASNDRGFKLLEYQKIASLQAYLMVWQDKPIVEVYSRQNPPQWNYTAYIGLETSFSLECLQCELKLADIYQWVEFEDATDAVEDSNGI